MSRPKMTDEQKATAKAAREAKVASPEPAAELPRLADYIAHRERDGVVLVRVSYPGVEPHVFQGRFSGVVVADGPLSCTYADGSTE